MTNKAAPVLPFRKPTEKSLDRMPPILMNAAHTYLTLARLNPDLHPAVLAAITAQPESTRQALVERARAMMLAFYVKDDAIVAAREAARKSARKCAGSAGGPAAGSAEGPAAGSAGGTAAGSAEGPAAGSAAGSASGSAAGSAAASPAGSPAAQQPAKILEATRSSDSDDVWEDAVEDLDFSSPASKDSGARAVPMASVVVDKAAELERLERESADCHRAWQTTRQLSAWTRYTECRKRISELKRGPGDEERERRADRWSQLQEQREIHERRLVCLNQRRERLRWSRRYDEQTRLHHWQLAQAELQDKLRQLDEQQQIRRLKHLQRVQQLVGELTAMEVKDNHRKTTTTTTPALSTEASKARKAPKTTASDAEGEFTHVWDDFCHWEKMVSDDDDEHEHLCEVRTSASVSPVGTRPPVPQPDVIPVLPAITMPTLNLPPAPGQAGPWQATGTSDAVSPGIVEDVGYEERKKWFEEALLTWHAQDEDEHVRLPAMHVDRVAADPPHWCQLAWNAWQGPATVTN